MSTDGHRRQLWEDAVRKTLNLNAQRHGSEEYVLLRGGQLVGASLSVFVKASVLPHIRNVEGAIKKTGMSGMAGNKGAVAIRMEYADTSICLVTAHLAAGFANYQERNQDYRTISNGLHFQRNRRIDDHNTVIWFGDFNYRIGMNNDRARQLIERGDLSTLYENDQLNIQMVHGQTFPHYAERTPIFLPTYKYNLGTDDYDSSEKARIPAWCDRIVTRGDNLRQIYYDTAPLKFSDHRPVWGTFQCTVSVVDQAKKDKISAELYQKRRASVGGHTASQDADSDDESLLGYDPIEPGLPPASSDRRKWWLDNGMPARSTVKPPSNGYVPNPTKPSNPFSPSSEPDWVKVDKPNGLPSRSTSVASASASSRVRSEAATRKLPPMSRAVEAAAMPPAKPPRPATFNESTSDDSKVQMKSTLRKPAPPKPNKPNLLRSESSRSTASVASNRSVPPPPEPRRSHAAAAAPSSSSVQGPALPIRVSSGLSESSGARSVAPQPPPPRQVLRKTAPDTANPPLPPRPQELMDDDGEQELKDWKPLQPR